MMAKRESPPHRVLDLAETCIENPQPHERRIIASMMLFPDDEDLRRRAWLAVEVKIWLEHGLYPPPQNPAEHRDLIDLIRDPTVARPADFTDAAKEGFRRGALAGYILLEAIATHAMHPGSVSLTKIKARISENFRTNQSTAPNLRRLSTKVIDNSIWKNFRCVAPYWAAHLILLRLDPPSVDGSREFWRPYRLEDTGRFLAIADGYRELGETIRSKQSPEPSILRPGETVALPKNVRLPPIEVDFYAT